MHTRDSYRLQKNGWSLLPVKHLSIIHSSIYNFIIFCDSATPLKKINSFIFHWKKKKILEVSLLFTRLPLLNSWGNVRKPWNNLLHDLGLILMMNQTLPRIFKLYCLIDINNSVFRDVHKEDSLKWLALVRKNPLHVDRTYWHWFKIDR